MIESFGNALAEDLFFDRQTRATRRFPAELRRAARRKVLYLHDAACSTTCGCRQVSYWRRSRSMKGFHSIRVNDQWRVVFRWSTAARSMLQWLNYH